MKARSSALIGALAGGWLATILLTTPWSPLRSAQADGPVFPLPPANPPSAGAGAGSGDPVSPTTPGRTINPAEGSRERGMPSSGFGTSSANANAIAITGPVAGGESVVYYFDTDTQRLLVYQYRSPGGGSVTSASDRGGIALVAARHIDYDLKLEDYRDRSEKTRDQLKAMYDASFGHPGKSEEMPVKKVEIPGGK
jgi:hypothetical protein